MTQTTQSTPQAAQAQELFVVTREQLDDLVYRTAKPRKALREAIAKADQVRNGMRVLRKTVWAEWTESNEIPVVSERDLRIAKAVSSVV